jgi:hypothetical protein
VTERNFPHNTCPASRHVELMAEALAKGERYAMFEEEPEHCAESLRSVIESLWKLRTAAQQDGVDGHGLSVRIEQRPDGGIRVWSPQVRGLILSGSDPVKVMADVWPAITALMEHQRRPEQTGE